MRTAIHMTAAAATLTAVTLLFAGPSAGAADEAIAAGNFYFCDPSFQNSVCETTITAGDTVTWTVVDGFHTVTACDAAFATCPPEGGFNSGTLAPGGQFQQTFETPGTFSYLCLFHPFQMRGVINVLAQETPTPAPTQAPTASPAPTVAPAPAPSQAGTPTPAGVPSTGGEPTGGSAGGPAIVLLGTLTAVAGMVFVLRAVRRARP